MVRKRIVINNISGLHLRPTGMLCNMAIRFQSTIHFEFNNGVTNVKSVLSVLGACVKAGDEIELVCEGPDEEEALAAMIQLIESGLGE